MDSEVFKLRLSLRELRGLGIVAAGGQIERVDENRFIVSSQSVDGAYHNVEWTNGKWICDCPDYLKRKKPCKHIFAVNFLLDLPRMLLANTVAFEIRCPYCRSKDVIQKGFRYNKTGPVKLFKCKTCNRIFSDTITPEKGGAKAALAAIAADLYYRGLSLREIRSHFKQVYNVDRPASTLHRWILRITNMLNEAFENVKLEVGEKWLADETVIKVDGAPKYLWNLMDYETRIYIASLITDGRGAEEALTAIKEAIKNAGKAPKTIVTDGLASYKKALEMLNAPIMHVDNAGITKKENNNRIERLHGTVKHWLKGKRGIGDKAAELIEGYRNYYNNIRLSIVANNAPLGGDNLNWMSVLNKKKKAPRQKCSLNPTISVSTGTSDERKVSYKVF